MSSSMASSSTWYSSYRFPSIGFPSTVFREPYTSGLLKTVIHQLLNHTCEIHTGYQIIGNRIVNFCHLIRVSVDTFLIYPYRQQYTVLRAADALLHCHILRYPFHAGNNKPASHPGLLFPFFKSTPAFGNEISCCTVTSTPPTASFICGIPPIFIAR